MYKRQLIFLILFVHSFFIGQNLYIKDREKAEIFLKKISESTKVRFIIDLFRRGKYVTAGSMIFMNNFIIAAIAVYSGIIFFIPLFILFSNAVITGILFGIESIASGTLSLFHLFFIILVGLLEISSLIISTYEGVRIGIGIIKPNISSKERLNKFKQGLYEATLMLSFVVVLLFIAAIIETTGIVIFNLKFVK